MRVGRRECEGGSVRVGRRKWRVERRECEGGEEGV